MISTKKAWSIFLAVLILVLIGLNLWIFLQIDHAIKEKDGVGKLITQTLQQE